MGLLFAVASMLARSERLLLLFPPLLPHDVPKRVLWWEKPRREGAGGARRAKGPRRVTGEEKAWVEYERVSGDALRREDLESGDNMSRVVTAPAIALVGGVLCSAGIDIVAM